MSYSPDRPLMPYSNQKLTSDRKALTAAVVVYGSVLALCGIAPAELPSYLPEANVAASYIINSSAIGLAFATSFNLIASVRGLGRNSRERWFRKVLTERALTPDEISAVQSLPNRSAQSLAQGLARGGSALRRLLPGGSIQSEL